MEVIDGGKENAPIGAITTTQTKEEDAGIGRRSLQRAAKVSQSGDPDLVKATIVASAQDWAMAQAVGKPKLRNVAQIDTAKARAAQSGADHDNQHTQGLP